MKKNILAITLSLLSSFFATENIQAQSLIDTYGSSNLLDAKPVAGFKENDKIMIEIEEDSSIAITNDWTTERASTIQHTLSAAQYRDVTKNRNGTQAVRPREYSFGKLARFIPSNVSLDSAIDEENAVAKDQTTILKAKVMANIVAVLDNGDLVVEGKSVIRMDDDLKTIKIGGIVSQKFISFRRSTNPFVIFKDGKKAFVKHYEIADLRIEYGLNGPSSRGANSGWAMRILSYIWPF
jgi:flagellar basal body L-ring protein FlgH